MGGWCRLKVRWDDQVEKVAAAVPEARFHGPDGRLISWVYNRSHAYHSVGLTGDALDSSGKPRCMSVHRYNRDCQVHGEGNPSTRVRDSFPASFCLDI
jgi:hypothetical protein